VKRNLSFVKGVGCFKLKIVVLRLSHRYIRDDRATSHLFLAARAFGAHGVIYTGQRDRKIEATIQEITETWGGLFDVTYRTKAADVIKEWKNGGGDIIHLSMYGLPLQNVVKDIRRSLADKLIVVGGSKVPKFVYEETDWNVAVTSQPHSEISAVSIFLHEFFEGRELSKSFEDAELVIVPQTRGKKIVRKSTGGSGL
jgi:tRNA (cytidine56-2'-O)-methyltransferase